MTQILLLLLSLFALSLASDDDTALCEEFGFPARDHPVKVFDGFTFFTELDILFVRFYELSPVVDRFILVESEATHSNRNKPLLFQKHSEKFKQWSHKISHIVAELPREVEMDTTSCEEDDHSCLNRPHWYREGFQRLEIRRGLEGAAPEDVLLISDADEIPSRETVLLLKNCHVPTPVTLHTHFYYYSFRWLWATDSGPHQWKYPNAINVGDQETFRVNPNDIRYFNPLPKTHLPNCGWHLSYFGGPKSVIRKIRALAHQENNTPERTNLTLIRNSINSGEDLFGRDNPHGKLTPSGIEFDPESKSFLTSYRLPALLVDLPEYCLRQFPHWFAEL